MKYSFTNSNSFVTWNPQCDIRECKLHVYDKRQTLKKLENEQIKTNQKIFVDKKLRETTNLCEEIMNSRRQAKGKLSHVAQIQFTFAV